MFDAPARERRSHSLRDTAAVGVVTLAGVVGLLIWSGGDLPAVDSVGAPGAGDQLDDPFGESMLEDDTPVAASATQSANDASDAAVAAQPAQAPAANQSPAVAQATTGQPSPADALVIPDDAYEVVVMQRDAFIATLPVPSGATEEPPDGAGVRTWTLPGTDWEPVRSSYLEALGTLGCTATMYQQIAQAGATGELYVLTDPTGEVNVQLAVGTFDGQIGIEVTRQ